MRRAFYRRNSEFLPGDGDMAAAADDYSFSRYGRHYVYLQFEMSIELTAGARPSYDRFGRRFVGRSD